MPTYLLLESVAASFEERAIAVVPHKTGGKVIAQDEITSEFFEMPSAAIATGVIDFTVPLGEMASTIDK